MARSLSYIDFQGNKVLLDRNDPYSLLIWGQAGSTNRFKAESHMAYNAKPVNISEPRWNAICKQIQTNGVYDFKRYKGFNGYYLGKPNYPFDDMQS